MGESAALLFMGTASIGGVASSLITADAQSEALKAQGEYQKSVFEMNSRLADMAAKDAISRGDTVALQKSREVKRVMGAQRAAYAAQGIEVDSGSALELQLDTAREGRSQVLTIKNNAFREAWGYKMEAINASAKGQMAQSIAGFEASNTILTGNLNALNYLTKGGYYMAKGGAFGSSRKTTSSAPELLEQPEYTR